MREKATRASEPPSGRRRADRRRDTLLRGGGNEWFTDYVRRRCSLLLLSLSRGPQR